MNDAAYPNEISNRMLYDLIVDQGQAIGRLEEKVTRLDEKVDRLEEKVGRLEEKVDRLELKVEKNSQRIEELLLKGDKVQIGFSRTMLAGNSFLAAVIAFIVAMFTGQYVVKLK